MTTVIAVMKKDETRRFSILSFSDGVVMLREEAEGSTVKEIIRKTFVKGYKLIEGSLEDVATESAQPKAATGSPIKSVNIIKSDVRDHRNVTVHLVDPDVDIETIDAASFIADLVENHGIVHGDRVVLDAGALGRVDLNGEEPSFSMHTPVLLDRSKAENPNDEMITLVYAKSGRRVTMTRGDFYSATIVGTHGPNKPKSNSDPLPDSFFDNAPLQQEVAPVGVGLGWATPAPPVLDIKPPTSEPVKWSLLPEPDEIIEDEPQNSMKASRDAKAAEAKPFMPEPYFLRQSMISSYEQCPDKMYDTYENGYSEESIFTRVGTAIHGLMEDFYNDRTINIDETFDKWWASNSTPEFDWYKDWKKFVSRYFEKEAKYEKPNVIVTELEYQTVVNGVPSSGTIDRIDRVDDQTIRIVDYKTNFKAFSDSELQESIQFMKYTADVDTEVVRQMLRDKGDTGEFSVIICTYEMLRLGIRQSVIYQPEEMVMFKDWMKVIWDMILSGQNRKPKLNQYCGFCQKRQRCDLYQEALVAPVTSILTETTNIEEVIKQRELLTMNAKLIKNRLDELEEQIKAEIYKNQGTLVVDGYEWNTKSGTRNVYPTQDVFRILAMNGLGDLIPDLVNVSKTSLDNVLKGNKEVMAQIEEKKQTSYTKASLNKKKIKPVKV